MAASSSLENLVEALRCLPGVGPKSAQRMAYQLLQHNREGAAELVAALHPTAAVAGTAASRMWRAAWVPSRAGLPSMHSTPWIDS